MSGLFVEIVDKYGKRWFVNMHQIVTVEPDPASKDYEKRCWVILTNGFKIHANETDTELMARMTGVQVAAQL